MECLKSTPLETRSALVTANHIWQELPVKNYIGHFCCERTFDASPTALTGQL